MPKMKERPASKLKGDVSVKIHSWYYSKSTSYEMISLFLVGRDALKMHYAQNTTYHSYIAIRHH